MIKQDKYVKKLDPNYMQNSWTNIQKCHIFDMELYALTQTQTARGFVIRSKRQNLYYDTTSYQIL